MTRFNHDPSVPENSNLSQLGFTLIELLVALTLFALLSIALLGGLRFGTRVWETGLERSAAFYEIEAIHSFLRDELSQARLMNESDNNENSTPTFLGTSERLQFVAPLPDYVSLGGFYRFDLRYSDDSDRGKAILSWELYRTDQQQNDDEESITTRVLMNNIDSLHIRYYGTLDTNDKEDWQDSWDSARRLPELIALQLDFPKEDGRSWPELVVAPFSAQNNP